MIHGSEQSERRRQQSDATRTARINAVRGHLREFGVSIPLGARKVIPQARAAIEAGAVPEPLRGAVLDSLGEIERSVLAPSDSNPNSKASPNRALPRSLS